MKSDTTHDSLGHARKLEHWFALVLRAMSLWVPETLGRRSHSSSLQTGRSRSTTIGLFHLFVPEGL